MFLRDKIESGVRIRPDGDWDYMAMTYCDAGSIAEDDNLLEEPDPFGYQNRFWDRNWIFIKEV